MRKILLLGTILTLLMISCWQKHETPDTPKLHKVAAFCLGESAELRLLTDSNLSQVELYYGGELQELAGTANTLFTTDDNGSIVLDTVHLAGDSLAAQYIVRTYDRSSTYGAEVWYVVYPLMPKLEEEGVGPWALAKVPWDLPGLVDIDGDGDKYLVYYEYGHTGRYSVYAFEAGIFSEIPSLRTLK